MQVRNRMFFSLIIVLSSVLLSSSKGRVDEKVLLQDLRCEMITNPEGIDVTHPRLSWVISGEQRGIVQTAYQMHVASSPERLAANSLQRKQALYRAVFEAGSGAY